MATIAVVRSTGQRGIVLGAGFGMFKAVRQSAVLSRTVQRETSGQRQLIALADENGEIGWFDSGDVQIVEIDGKPPHALLGGDAYR